MSISIMSHFFLLKTLQFIIAREHLITIAMSLLLLAESPLH